MSSTTEEYYQIPSDGGDSYRTRSSRISKVGAAFIGGGGCLMLLSMIALFVPDSKLQNNFATKSTDLVSLPTSVRTGSMSAIGGLSPFKQLAIEAINVNNRCDRDRGVAMKALLTNFAKTNPKSMTVLAEAAAGAENKVKTMPGVLPPLGFWDPWGLSTNAGDDTIAYYREAELKHGRTCMLAFLGIVAGETFHPFNGGGAVDILGIPIESTPTSSFFANVVLSLIGLQEFRSAARMQGLMNGDKSVVPGDLGFDPLGFKASMTEEKFLDMQNKELSNGRLAMLAVAGAIAQEQVTLQKLFR